MSPSFDSDGYPTEEFLNYIEHCGFNEIKELLLNLGKAWYYPEAYRISETKPEEVVDNEKPGTWIRMATLGWSGNESIVYALEKNPIARIYWYMSMRGGLSIYFIP